MDQRPEQPPEGRLIADAANRLDLSIREAARRAGISYGRWRQIVMGYQNISPGVYAPVHAPAKTVAKMATVVGVTAEQMETEGQRPDVAEMLRHETGRPASAPPDDPDDLPLISPAMAASMRPHIAEIRVRVEMARSAHPGEPLTGAMIFPLPAQRQYRDTWDVMAGFGYGPEALIHFAALAMAYDVEQAEIDRNPGIAAGLMRR